VWVECWYLMYLHLEMMGWRHETLSPASNSDPNAASAIRPHPKQPLILLTSRASHPCSWS